MPAANGFQLRWQGTSPASMLCQFHHLLSFVFLSMSETDWLVFLSTPASNTLLKGQKHAAYGTT
jgi:hypothetical protein